MHNLFNACKNKQRLNHRRQEPKHIEFTVYIFETPVTLKQSQGHQTYIDNVDSKQGYNHAKFERSCINGVREKSQRYFVFSSGK